MSERPTPATQPVREIVVNDLRGPPLPTSRPDVAPRGVIVVNDARTNADRYPAPRGEGLWYDFPVDLAVGMQNEQSGRWDAEMAAIDRLMQPQRTAQQSHQAALQAERARIWALLPASLVNTFLSAQEQRNAALLAKAEAQDALDVHEQRWAQATTADALKTWRFEERVLRDTYEFQMMAAQQTQAAYEEQRGHLRAALQRLLLQERDRLDQDLRAAQERAEALRHQAEKLVSTATMQHTAVAAVYDDVYTNGLASFDEVDHVSE